MGPAQRSISPATNFAKYSRAPALGRRDLLAEAFEALAHGRRVQCLAQCTIEPAHDRLGRALGQEDALPGGHVERRAPARGRSAGSAACGARRRSGARDRFDLIALDLRLRGRGRVAHDSRCGRRSGPAWRVRGRDRECALTSTPSAALSSTQLMCDAEPAPAEPYFTRRLVRLHIGDELGQRVGGKILRRDQDARRLHDQSDRA